MMPTSGINNWPRPKETMSQLVRRSPEGALHHLHDQPDTNSASALWPLHYIRKRTLDPSSSLAVSLPDHPGATQLVGNSVPSITKSPLHESTQKLHGRPAKGDLQKRSPQVEGPVGPDVMPTGGPAAPALYRGGKHKHKKHHGHQGKAVKHHGHQGRHAKHHGHRPAVPAAVRPSMAAGDGAVADTSMAADSAGAVDGTVAASAA